MQLGMIGLGRMGAGMARRLAKDGHSCVVFDLRPAAVKKLAGRGIRGAASIDALLAKLARPRAVWVMVPAGATGRTVENLAARMDAGDTIIDGGNSYHRDAVAMAKVLKPKGIHYVDCGTSGGVRSRARLLPDDRRGKRGRQAARSDFQEHRARHQGGAAHPGQNRQAGSGRARLFALRPERRGPLRQMVHNGIEYGLMAAYAEGLNILHQANAGKRSRVADAETAPLRNPQHYHYELDLPGIAEVWRRGSVIGSWLLDLSAASLLDSPDLKNYAGRVSDSGEGRWTLEAAIEVGVPAPVLGAALFERFSSRDGADFSNRVLSAMRKQFGGHEERKKGKR